MKKRLFKNRYLKLGILFLGLFILTINCSDDNEIMLLPEQESNIIIKKLNYEDILIDKKVVQKIEEIKLKKESLVSSKSTNKYVADYDFYIDLETVKMVETDNHKTYNFSIQRKNSENKKVENLFLTLNQDGEYDAYILKYDFTADELENLDQEKLKIKRTKYTPIDFNLTPNELISSKYICTELWNLIEVNSPRDFGYDDDEGNNNTTYEWVLISSDCAFYYEGAGISTGSNTNDGSGPSGGASGTTSGTGTSNDTKYVYSTPVTLSPEEAAINFFFDSLTLEQEDCLKSKSGLNREIESFLSKYFDPNTDSPYAQKTSASSRLPGVNNGFTFTDARNFVKLALDNCGEVDWDERIILDPTFKNNPKALCAYKKLKEAGGIKQILKDFFNTQETANLIIKLESNLTCTSSNPFGCASFNTSTQTATIKIDEDFISQFQWQNSGGVYQTPMLSIAKVIIHESIHAQLFYNQYQANNNIPVSNLTFEELYEEYRNLEGWQHQFMADHYLSTISSALEEVHPLLNDQTYINYINNNYPDWTWQQIYKNLAWSGLTQTPAGQTYLSNSDNATLYSLQNTNVATNSNETQNCN